MNLSTGLLETERVALSSGKHIRVAWSGSGPTVVFLHGYPENLQVWSRVIPLLTDRFETIAIDWPGMGYSDEWPGGATPQIKAKHLLAILDELNIERPILVGLDMGGQPALAFAAAYPDRIARLVVMNSLAFGDEKTSWEIRLLRRFGLNRFALKHLPGIVFRRAVRTFVPAGFRVDEQLRDDFWTAFSEPCVRRFVSKMCAGYQGALPSLPELYASIRCPTLVLWGDRDKHFPMVQAERLHETVPGSTLKIVAGGTHWMPLTNAEEVARQIAVACLAETS